MMDGGCLTSRFQSIPGGLAGVKATLRTMVKVARECLKPKTQARVDDLLFMRLLAQNCLAEAMCAEKDWQAEAAAIHAFVRDHIVYRRDLRMTETLQYPRQTLDFGYGDCDDKALLFCTLAECTGAETRFCAISVDNEPEFSHVSGQILIPGSGWVNAETIPVDNQGTRVPLGWFPPEATCLMLAHI